MLRSDQIIEAGTGGPTSTAPVGSNNCNPNGCHSCDFGGSLMYYKSPQGIRPMSTSQGNHIGYSDVKVSQAGNGYTLYRYYGSDRWDTNTGEVAETNVNTKPPCSLFIPNFPSVPLQFEPKRGELKYEEYYGESGIVKEMVHYIDVSEDKVTTPGTILASAGVVVSSEYDLKAFRIKSRKTEEINYRTGGNNINTSAETLFESIFHNQPTKTITYTSIGDVLYNKYKYAFDFRTTCDATSDCFANYQDAVNAINRQYYQDKYSCATMGCQYNTYQTFKKNLAKARASYIACRKANYTDPNSNTFSNCFVSKKDAANTELKPILELQDEYKNPVIESSAYKNNNLISASFNRFDYGMNGSAFVYPNKLQTLFPSSLATTFTNSATSSSGTSVTKDSRYADEAFYKFSNGIPAEATGKDGVTTSYIWDNTKTLPIVKAVGVDATTLNNAYTAVGGNLTLLRSHSSLSNAKISTYTYSPLLGLTSETDPSGKVINYEYDKLGRLTVIKDQNGNIIKKNEYKYAGQP